MSSPNQGHGRQDISLGDQIRKLGHSPTIGDVEKLIPLARTAIGKHALTGGALEGLNPGTGIGLRPEIGEGVFVIVTIHPSRAQEVSLKWPREIDGAPVCYEFDNLVAD